jgi:uncharacterized protein (TIGR02246 family)
MESTMTVTAPPVPDEDLATIRQLVADAQAHQVDVEPFLALHTPETAIVNIAGRRVLGRDVLRRAMEQAVSGSLARVTTTVDVDDIRLLRPDVALVSCTKHVTDERTTGERSATDATFPSTGSLTYVVVRDDDTWRIASAQTTPILGS